MKRRYNTPKSVWPQKEILKEIPKVEIPKAEISENAKIETSQKPKSETLHYLSVTNETRLFWTLGLISILILILITLSLLIATLQNARLLSLLISKK